MGIDSLLSGLAALHPKLIDLSLDRVLRLLDALGRPHLKLPPVVHVAGTNGKGSVTAYLAAMARAQGLAAHVYISPHLVRFNERIVLRGREIEDAQLLDVLQRTERANAGQPITFFEVTTVAAFLAFAETPADALVLEVGLGGRLDATNVVERPVVTAITRVSYDHPQFLGTAIDGIAAEKAGIARRGVPLVVGPQTEAAAVAAIERRAAEAGAPLDLCGEDWTVEPVPGGFRLTDRASTRLFAAPALPGPHQIANAATAIRCLDRSGLAIPEAAVRRGLATVEWPARLERLRAGPLVEAAPPGWEVWLDGGHNDSAGEALAAWLATLPAAPLHLVLGMIESKAPAAFLAPIAPFVTRLRAVPVPGEQAGLPPEALVAHARAVGIADAAAAPDPAIAAAAAPPGPPGRILVCGSLYLAGAVLAAIG